METQICKYVLLCKLVIGFVSIHANSISERGLQNQSGASNFDLDWEKIDKKEKSNIITIVVIPKMAHVLLCM